MADTDRSYDLADMLVRSQREAEKPAPDDAAIEMYFYQGIDGDTILVGGNVTATPSGPLYYVSPTPSGDEIICGAWVAA